jgi:hypothetical protein
MLKTIIHDGVPRLAALVLLFSGCLGATTATVFSNFGPGDSFDSDGRSVGKASGTYNNAGGQFTVSGSDFNFTSAEAALQYFSGANQVTFGIRSDASGLPGTLLQTFVATNIPSVSPGGIVLFNATAPLVLSAGSTYWLTSEQYSPSDTQVSWRYNNQGSAGLSIRISTGAWVNGSQPTPAFRINGESVDAPAVPEPGSLSLLALGAAGMFVHGRRRSRKLVKRLD